MAKDHSADYLCSQMSRLPGGRQGFSQKKIKSVFFCAICERKKWLTDPTPACRQTGIFTEK
jgi:hypothetical protein